MFLIQPNINKKKTITCFLIIALVFDSAIASGFPISSFSPENPEVQWSLPNHLGLIQDVESAGKQTLIHIQDAHANPDAQKKIKTT